MRKGNGGFPLSDQDYRNVLIYKSHSAPQVQRWCNGRQETALNWQELAHDAMCAIESELRRRWLAYWDTCTAQASVAHNTSNINELMKIIRLPSEYYDCPVEIAARAIWPTSQPDMLLLVDTGN
jgi:hypothetical protein